MPSAPHRCAASSLLAPLFDGDQVELVEVARTPVSVHYATGRADLPVLSVVVREAVRLPNSLLCDTLPGAGKAVVRGRRLLYADEEWTVSRWWRPGRPLRLTAPPAPARPGRGLVPSSLIGSGPGLTPSGDDIVAGALVAAYALRHPARTLWARQTLRALRAGRTTAVSHALLRHAVDGYAVPQLSAYVDALTSGAPVTDAQRALLAVGHSSGAALLEGVERVIPASLGRVA